MKAETITVKLRDGEMGAYIAYPDRTPSGAIIAIMEIWGVNDTMRRHAQEFAEAGFVCLCRTCSGARSRAWSFTIAIPRT